MLIAFAVTISCGNENGRTGERETDKTDEQVLHVAVMPTLDCLPIYVASRQKIFDKHNLAVQLHTFLAQMDCDTALTGNTVQVAATDLVRAEQIQKGGTKLIYVTATNAYWQLIAAHNARIKEPKQLGDKMIGMARLSATDLLTEAVIKEAKPTNKAYKIQINDIGIRLKMLNNSQLDAAWLPEPHATMSKIAKNNVIADSREQKMALGVIVFKATQQNNQLQSFIKAYNEAADSIGKYGMKHYLRQLKEQMALDDKTIQALPNTEYKHAKSPEEKDIQTAKTITLNP